MAYSLFETKKTSSTERRELCHNRMAVRRPRSVSGPLDGTAWRGADRTQAHRRAPLPQINTPDPQARRSLKKDGTEELDGTQQNVTLLQNKVPQLPLGWPLLAPSRGVHVTHSS